MQADAVAGAAGKTDFTVARVNQEFANRSSLGFLIVNKEADDLATQGPMTTTGPMLSMDD